jgi:hypothetical protein
MTETARAGGVVLPFAAARTLLPRVRLVQFYDHAATEGHPAPDPVLLAAKTARNWCQTHGQLLKAVAEPEVDSEDELDDLALEQYLEWRQNLVRPKTWDDLARGLGQPHGYQEWTQKEEEGQSKVLEKHL